VADHKSKCNHPDCKRIGECARGFCHAHYVEFRRDCKANGSWRPYDEILEKTETASRPKWEFEGNEAALIAAQEATDKNRGDFRSPLTSATGFHQIATITSCDLSRHFDRRCCS
jgi:hypothetical protein